MTTAFYTHADCKRHEMGSWHPECPERLQAIEDQLIASRIDGLIDYREAPPADESELARVHTADAIYRIRENCPTEKSEYTYFPLDADTCLNAYSWRPPLNKVIAATRLRGLHGGLRSEVLHPNGSVPRGYHQEGRQRKRVVVSCAGLRRGRSSRSFGFGNPRDPVSVCTPGSGKGQGGGWGSWVGGDKPSGSFLLNAGLKGLPATRGSPQPVGPTFSRSLGRGAVLCGHRPGIGSPAGPWQD